MTLQSHTLKKESLKHLCSFILLLCSAGVFAQFTDIINSNRPGASDTPYSVGVGIHQIESGLIFADNNQTTEGSTRETIGVELVYRTGLFFERLEFDLRAAYTDAKQQFIQDDALLSKKVNGISDLGIGAKLMLYEQKYADKSKEIRSWKKRYSFDKKRLIPTVGIYTGFNTNLVNSAFKDEFDEASFKAILLLQNNLSDRFVLINNVIIEKIAKENQYFQHSITGTYSFSTIFSGYIESVGRYSPESKPIFDHGLGFAYLLSPDLQIDLSFRSNLANDYDSFLISAGVAWRLQDRIPRFK